MRFHDTAAVERAADTIGRRLGTGARAAAILGSGFSSIVDLLDDRRSLGFAEVPGLETCTAPGHAGEIVAGGLGGVRYVVFNGRLHLYEDLEAAEVVAPVAIARALGADRILLTAAVGATDETTPPGALVLIEDHINLTGANPLLDVPAAERRPAFLSMEDAYDPAALAMAERAASRLPGGARRAVLASLPGPTYETPAEYRALSRLGADVVSMSCALETIAARSLRMRVVALAIVANGPARPGAAAASAEAVLAAVDSGARARLSFFRAVLEGLARV